MKISILGVEYEIIRQNANENPKMKDCDGLCEWVTKKIIYSDDYRNDEDVLDDVDGYIHKVIRHEAFHALFVEMGIKKWYQDEELVDMLALQYPKIRRIMDECDNMKLEDIDASKEG